MSDSPKDPITNAGALPRRALLKGTAGILASGIFPAVHAADPIVLRYLGTAVNQDKEIADKFKADTGITIQYVAVTTDDVTKRAITAPNSFDLLDSEFFQLVLKGSQAGFLGVEFALGVREFLGVRIVTSTLAVSFENPVEATAEFVHHLELLDDVADDLDDQRQHLVGLIDGEKLLRRDRLGDGHQVFPRERRTD